MPNFQSLSALLLSISTLLLSNFVQAGSPELNQDQQVLAAITTVKNSRTLLELNNSPYSPHAMMAKSGHGLCSALLKLNLSDLSYLQEELHHHRDLPQLQSCLAILNFRLNTYYRGLNQKLVSKMDFKKSLTRFSLNELSVEPQPQFTNKVRVLEAKRPQVFVYGDLRPKELLLSFDDGPHSENTPLILKTLADFGAKVHFFSQGSNAVKYPELLQKAAFYGHSIGSHSFSHPPLGIQLNKGTIQISQAMEEISKGHSAVFAAAGWIDPFFRFPYGSTTPELNKAVKAAGAFSFFWNIDTLDWKTPDPEQLLLNSLAEIEKAGQKGIVLMHDVQRQTALMLPHLLDELVRQGYTLYVFTPDDQEIRFKNSPLVKTEN